MRNIIVPQGNFQIKSEEKSKISAYSVVSGPREIKDDKQRQQERLDRFFNN